jgi:hypothetical protein
MRGPRRLKVAVWQMEIHDPFIRTAGGIGSDWNWPALFLGCHTIEQALGRQALAVQLRVSAPDGTSIPVARAIYTCLASTQETPGSTASSSGSWPQRRSRR